MPRLLPRLIAVFAVVAIAVGGFRAWQQQREQHRWAALRPAVPAPVGDTAPGLDARLAACAQRFKAWPPDHAALREFARTCHANGQLDAASAAYQALIALEPADAHWPYLLASIRAGFGQLDEALPLLRRTTELAPDYITGWLKFGDALLKSNSTAEADTAYREVLRREPGNHYALLGLARCDLQAGRLTAARSHLQQAVADHPDFAGAQSLLGTVFERLGNTEAAALARSRVEHGGHYTEPADPWLTDLINDCHDPYTLLVAASAALADRRPAAALPLLQRALQLAPDDARLHRQLGKTLAATGDISGARAAMEHAVHLAPANEPMHLDLLTVIRQTHDEAALAAAVARGVAACPDSPALHYEAGLLASHANQLEAATRHFEFAWKNRPDQTAAAYELADVQFRRRQDAAGLAVLADLLAHAPNESPALLLLVRHGIAAGDPRAAGWLQRAIDAHAPAAIVAELRQDYQRRFGAFP